jgi:hypothetical protein
MSTWPTIEARDHPMVLAAQARLAVVGAWDDVLAGRPLVRDLDRVDAALLVAAGVLRPRDGGTFDVSDDGPWNARPETLAGYCLAQLRRSLRHAESTDAGWSGHDPATLLAQGRGSAAVADLLADHFLPRMPAAQDSFRGPGGRFLDVGVGVAAISIRLCELFPGTTAVGIDVLDHVLELARNEVERHGCEDRVELRLQPVSRLREVRAFDLAWVPQPFIAPAEFRRGLRRVHAALRPDRWVVAPLAAADDTADAFSQALSAHAAHLLGGGPTDGEKAMGLLVDAGYVDVSREVLHGQQFVLGRRP